MSKKQRAFIDEYLTDPDANGTDAAARAGYKGNRATLAAVAYENLRKPHIRTVIEERLKDKAMGADEVLARLTDIARGRLSDFISIARPADDPRPYIDLIKGLEVGKGHLLKKVALTTRRYGSGKEAVTEERVEIELYDAQAALVSIGKHHRLFAERLDIHDWRSEVRDVGINDSELHEQFVQFFTSNLRKSAKPASG